MIRKLYETSGDIENETRVINSLRQAWHPVSINTLPKKYVLDAFAEFDGGGHAWLEVKCRTVASTTFETYMISYRKIVEGINYADAKGGSFLLVVEWTDGIFACNVHDAMPHTRMGFGGRKDRDDREDSEPMLLIPVRLFVKIDVDRTAQ